MSLKQTYINFIDKEITSGRYSGPRENRLADIPFPSGFDKENKLMKGNWDKAMKHCKKWCAEIDDFNSGKKIKGFIK